MSTYVDMKKKHTPPKESSKDEDSFIGPVSKFAGERLHVEVPQKQRKRFKAGEYVKVEKIKRWNYGL